MFKYFTLLRFTLIAVLIFDGCSTQNGSTGITQKNPILTGDYLGQEPPGLDARLFAPGIISTGNAEFSSTFSLDGKLFCYALAGTSYSSIIIVRRINQVWQEPQVAPFSGRYREGDLNFSPDGKKLYYWSMRPIEGVGEPVPPAIWVAERTLDGWFEPRNTGIFKAGGPSVTNDGTIYFFGDFVAGRNETDIYKCQFIDNQYGQRENLGFPINTEFREIDPFIAPDESYVIFASDRPDGYGDVDLYVSFRDENGTWSTPKNLGDKVNSSAEEYCPSITPDDKYLFFTRRENFTKPYSEIALTYKEIVKSTTDPKNGKGDIYWVDARIIWKINLE